MYTKVERLKAELDQLSSTDSVQQAAAERSKCVEVISIHLLLCAWVLAPNSYLTQQLEKQVSNLTQQLEHVQSQLQEDHRMVLISNLVVMLVWHPQSEIIQHCDPVVLF